MKWNRGQGTGKTPGSSRAPTVAVTYPYPPTSALAAARGFRSAPTKDSPKPIPSKAGEGFVTRWCWWDEVSWTSYEQVCWHCGRTDGVMTTRPIFRVQEWRENQGRS